MPPKRRSPGSIAASGSSAAACSVVHCLRSRLMLQSMAFLQGCSLASMRAGDAASGGLRGVGSMVPLPCPAEVDETPLRRAGRPADLGRGAARSGPSPRRSSTDDNVCLFLWPGDRRGATSRIEPSSGDFGRLGKETPHVWIDARVRTCLRAGVPDPRALHRRRTDRPTVRRRAGANGSAGTARPLPLLPARGGAAARDFERSCSRTSSTSSSASSFPATRTCSATSSVNRTASAIRCRRRSGSAAPR